MTPNGRLPQVAQHPIESRHGKLRGRRNFDANWSPTACEINNEARLDPPRSCAPVARTTREVVVRRERFAASESDLKVGILHFCTR